MVFQFLKSGYQKLTNALSRARSFFSQAIHRLFQGPIDEKMLEQLEELLYQADFGVATATELTNRVRELYKQNPKAEGSFYLEQIQNELIALLSKTPSQLQYASSPPSIYLIVGVNGNGKTTSVAKLAHLFKKENKRVLISAADTFRAAATEQLEIWAQRLEIELVKGKPGSDPSALVFDSITAAKARSHNVVLIDTAGRLHTKTALMQELEKIKRTCHKVCPGSPHETLLVLDATVGQNAVDQAKQFHAAVPLTGIILTKLDGTAKGGIVIAIQRAIGVPIKFIGLGESVEDIAPFDPTSFVKGLFE